MPDDAPAKAPVQVEAPQAFDLTVDEFCARLSATDRRPELIYAFSRDELRAGRVKDSTANFTSRFASFANRPA